MIQPPLRCMLIVISQKTFNITVSSPTSSYNIGLLISQSQGVGGNWFIENSTKRHEALEITPQTSY